MAEVLWSRTMDGARPGVLVGDTRILLHFEAGTSTTLKAFDFGGRELWTRAGLRGHETLPGDRFLVTTAYDEPLVLDGSGEVGRRWGAGGVKQVARHDGVVVLADDARVWGASLDLDRRWEVAWPAGSRPNIDCFVGGRFFWATETELQSCDREGTARTHAALPEGLITETRERYTRKVGLDEALTGSMPYNWRLSFDDDRERFFLATAFMPHMVLCLDGAGRPEWCVCLSPGCCGGTPRRLPDGRYAASSGCGGVVSWLDDRGSVLFQSPPHPGVGLATAYTSDVRLLPGGTVLAEGGPGIVAYDSAGRLAWTFDRSYSHTHYDSAGEFLVGCYWRSVRPERVTLEFVTGLSTPLVSPDKLDQ